jgi:DNA-binding NarL/FixJ family response regulator
MKPIRVVLADDHALVRARIRALLQQCAGIEVSGEAGNGRDALALVGAVHPHVVLMDIMMPGMNGLEALAHVAREWAGARTLVLSVHTDSESVLGALRAGAAGYLVKDAAAGELEVAVRAVARGDTYLSPAVSNHVVAGFAQGLEGKATRLELLTPRHREVLQLIAEGHTTKEIAQALRISGKTAENHRAELMERLRIHDVAGLVRYAVRVGLVSADQ